MNFSNLIWLAGTAATTGAAEGAEPTGFALFFAKYGSLIMIVLMIVIMYFLMIRPQQKKQKEEQKMRNNLRVGDEVTTIGGIKGRVVSIKDDTITIETGADRSKIQFEKWGLQTVHTKHEDPVDDDFDDDDDDV